MEKHIHKYKRVKFESGHVILKCMIAGCPHYLPHLETAIARECQCWGCGGKVIIDQENIKLAKITCSNCRELRKQRREKEKELIVR